MSQRSAPPTGVRVLLGGVLAAGPPAMVPIAASAVGPTASRAGGVLRQRRRSAP